MMRILSVRLSVRPSVTRVDHTVLPATRTRAVPAFTPRPQGVTALGGTHCAYPRRNGQAELIWVAGYVPR